MLKRTIQYTDFNGNQRQEDFYFNLTKAELLEMEMSTSGGLDQMIKDIMAAQDIPEIIRIFKDMILKAYGVKSPDGRQFNKSKEISDSFAHTEAYSVLFMELSTDADAASKFVNGIVPADIEKTIMPEPILH